MAAAAGRFGRIHQVALAEAQASVRAASAREPCRAVTRDDDEVHRVVDAMNVIGSRPDGWWRDRGRAIERLVDGLDRWVEGREERVTVMLEHEPRRELRAERVEIAWASVGGANAADREILTRLSGWLADDEVVVVTSDRDLTRKARAAGAEVTPSRPFRAELDSSWPR